jgi:2-oxoglutarate ferredoxin oxidoreductase subunit beta
MLNWQKDHAITIAAAAKASPEQLAGKFLIGEFVNKEAPEFSDVYWEMSRKAQLQQKEAE